MIPLIVGMVRRAYWPIILEREIKQMDLIMLFSDLFGFSVNSCLTDFSCNEEKHGFYLVLEWFSSYIGMVWYFPFLLDFFPFPFVRL